MQQLLGKAALRWVRLEVVLVFGKSSAIRSVCGVVVPVIEQHLRRALGGAGVRFCGCILRKRCARRQADSHQNQSCFSQNPHATSPENPKFRQEKSMRFAQQLGNNFRLSAIRSAATTAPGSSAPAHCALRRLPHPPASRDNAACANRSSFSNRRNGSIPSFPARCAHADRASTPRRLRVVQCHTRTASNVTSTQSAAWSPHSLLP